MYPKLKYPNHVDSYIGTTKGYSELAKARYLTSPLLNSAPKQQFLASLLKI